MLKEYNQAFGKTPSVVEERIAFANRADHLLTLVRTRVGSYDDFFKSVCFELGIRPSDYKRDYRRDGSLFMNLGSVAANDFHRMVEILIATLKTSKANPPLYSFIDQSIHSIMHRATAALGVSYDSGMFYPAGEPALDQDLINHSLRVLAGYPAEDKDLRLALDDYRADKKDGIVETCYRCLEGLTRQVLSNGKTLINNKADLLRRLGLTDPWNSTLAAYIDFGNDYGRHASAERHDATEAEVEAYLYLTCLLVRLIVKIK
ncbi:hypothetical protein Q4E93_13100 [Flavitalea sp. BT771]|uniref:hypothetical protein n=1 Tax=Flavitalea sp. BT771 TaxID=3063329 RepID=UPI0026E40561|nr:hypothetical protein [Flavitalea sp. BT771]MDO6431535.1 hypothetical protein [Flavitalea sp. BT771]MDV6220443.1 hypothetical protein [Flavitalea sp. BT771]